MKALQITVPFSDLSVWCRLSLEIFILFFALTLLFWYLLYPIFAQSSQRAQRFSIKLFCVQSFVANIELSTWNEIKTLLKNGSDFPIWVINSLIFTGLSALNFLIFIISWDLHNLSQYLKGDVINRSFSPWNYSEIKGNDTSLYLLRKLFGDNNRSLRSGKALIKTSEWHNFGYKIQNWIFQKIWN